jgi:hypothetical protein
MTRTFRNWKKMLPFTVPDRVWDEVGANWLSRYPGVITSGSGGGYVIVASESPIPGALKIRVKY